MKIAIDVSPLESGHKIRGVGFYVQYLKESLLKYYPEVDYQFFTHASQIATDADIVHYPYFDPFFLTLPFTKNYKTIVTVHDLVPLIFKEHFPAGIKGNLRWQIQKYNLKKVDAIIADSLTSKQDITKIAGIKQDKVFVVHLAGSEAFKQLKEKEINKEQLRKKYNLPEEFALYVGDVTWNKNVLRLAKAATEAEVPLVMVGKSLVSQEFDTKNVWNKELVEVQKFVEKNKYIRRLGFVPTSDLVVLYNTASVFVFPSIYEGFGLPVIEAMQSGCPVITTQGGSLQEVAGEAARLVNPFDGSTIAKAMREVFNSKKLQKELREKGLKQAQKYSWEKTAEQTYAVYDSVFRTI